MNCSELTNRYSRENLISIRKKLKKNLPEKRYEHSLGVEYTSACLAMVYGVDIQKAELAGLVHDCAKHFSDKELISLCRQAGIELTTSELDSSQILHAIYGPVLAKREYGIEDEEVLSAVRWHTTGKADMSLLDMIVYTADYIEPSRQRLERIDEFRKLAFSNLKLCVYKITETIIKYLKADGLSIDGATLQCYDWIKKEV